jgi:hypothetical protein
LANAIAEVIWVQTLLTKLSINHPKVAKIWCENLGAMSTGDQVADVFTKSLTVRQLQAFLYNLNLDKVVIKEGCKTIDSRYL